MTEADEIIVLRQALAEAQQRQQSVIDVAGGPMGSTPAAAPT
ncbi:MAG: hypothetical protein Q7U73_15050 [Rubrivivax sp.]|nr:hypothetical protein [Rubrivivax sp.]